MKLSAKMRMSLAAVVLATSLISITQAQSYYVAGSGLAQSWSTGVPDYLMSGGPTVYTLSVSTLGGPYHEFKIVGSSWSDPNWPAKNVRVMSDANGSNTIYFYPGVTVDGWYPVSDRVGYADPGNMSFEVAGEFNGWGGGAGYQLTALGNGVHSNSIVVPTAGTYSFKFRTPGTWGEVNFGADFGNDGPNGSFTTTTSPEIVAVQLDLPGGRWVIGSPAPPPVTNQVVFAVDMSSQITLSNFVPGVDIVYASGSFNGWPGTGPAALVLTNDPPYNGNTNIYYATNPVVGLPNSEGGQYKFSSSSPAYAGTSGYEPRPGNRAFNLLPTSGVALLPVVKFGDVDAAEVLPVDTLVIFTINMTNAVTSTNAPSSLNSPPEMNTPYLFDPDMGDSVFINGSFLSGGWTGWSPLAMVGNDLSANPPGSRMYQFSKLMPKGSPVRIQYKYGMNYGSNPSYDGTIDNEAPMLQDRVRYIRQTATGIYALPVDTFGDQHVEPSYGGLGVGPGSGGMVPLSWLGRPGAHVQTSTNIAGPWVDCLETDGATWTSGAGSPDGFRSITNWPNTGGNRFFRMVGP